MTDLISRLKDAPRFGDPILCDEAATEIRRLRADAERLRRALHDIAEEWAGAECGEPVTAQEAYAIGLAKRMYALAADALKETP